MRVRALFRSLNDTASSLGLGGRLASPPLAEARRRGCRESLDRLESTDRRTSVLLRTKTVHRGDRIVWYLRRRMHGTTCHHPRCELTWLSQGVWGHVSKVAADQYRSEGRYQHSHLRSRQGRGTVRVSRWRDDTIPTDGPGPTAPRAIGCRFRFHPTNRCPFRAAPWLRKWERPWLSDSASSSLGRFACDGGRGRPVKREGVSVMTSLISEMAGLKPRRDSEPL